MTTSAGAHESLEERRLEVPLNVRPWSGGLRLAISVSPVTAVGEVLAGQELVLDTGSSTLAFCNSSLAGAGQALEYMSCNMYNPGGSPTGYWGRFYRGDLALASGLELGGGVYSVMQAQESMPCTQGFGGIFGIAFRQLDMAFPYEDLGTDLSAGGGLACPSAPVADAVEPLMQALKAAAGAASLGIYWSGETGEAEAALFLEEAARTNAHAVGGAAAGVAQMGEMGFYDITVLEMTLTATGLAWDESTFACGSQSSKTACIMDTGTPVLVVPQSVVDGINEALSAGSPLGSLTVALAGAGAGGLPVRLEFDLATLVERQWIQAGGSTNVILGLPLWRWYYTVFDIQESTATFISTAPGSSSSSSSPPALAAAVAEQQGPGAEARPALPDASPSSSGDVRRLTDRSAVLV